jgi:hypothetical protein
VVSNQWLADLPVYMVAGPQALLACVARDDADDGETIIGIGAVPSTLIGAPPCWIGGIAIWSAFSPGVLVQRVRLKSGTGHHAGRRRVV